MENNQNNETIATNEPTPEPEKPAEWKDLGLSPEILETVTQAGFSHPTPVQAETIPIAIQRRDVIASAQTGTGKTASFVLPMVQNFKGREGTFGLILAPTREIAIQIHDTITLLGGPHGVRSIVLIGGVDYRKDAEGINSYPQIIVATPGRLCDHLDRGNLWLDFIQMVILDEADRMLDMGFASQLARIMEEVPTERQTMLFSATIPPSVQKLATKILVDPTRVSIGKPLSAAHSVEQRLLYMKEESKNRELMRLLRQEPGSLIVFTRSKDGATRVWRSLHSAGVYDATYIHSDRLQAHREQALTDFKAAKYRILIATDVAARGIHINDVAHVVNYDLPMEPEDYIHRIGRTGRAGLTGKSTTFVTPRDRKTIMAIEKLLGRAINAEYTPSWPAADTVFEPEERGRGPSRGGGKNRDRGPKNDRGEKSSRDQGSRDQPSHAAKPENAPPPPRPTPSPTTGAPVVRILPRAEGAPIPSKPEASNAPSQKPNREKDAEPLDASSDSSAKRPRRGRGGKGATRSKNDPSDGGSSGNDGGGTAFPV